MKLSAVRRKVPGVDVVWIVAALVGWVAFCAAITGYLHTRPSFQRELDHLQDATVAMKVEVGAALLPAFRKMTDAMAKIAR